MEDLYCLDQASRASPAEDFLGQEEPDEATGSFSSSVMDNTQVLSPDSVDTTTSDGSCDVAEPHSSDSLLATSDEEQLSSFSSVVKNFEFIGSMFGAIKDISVSNIHSDESDKTTDFLSKDLASIFASWDTGSSGGMAAAVCEGNLNAKRGHARRPLTLEDSSWKGACGISSAGKSQIRSSRLASMGSHVEHGSTSREVSQPENSQSCSLLFDFQSDEHRSCEDSSNDKLYTVGHLPAQEVSPPEGVLKQDEDFGTASLLEIAENLLQMTADAHSHIREAETSLCGIAMSPEMSERAVTMHSSLLALSQDISQTFAGNAHTISDKGDRKQQYNSSTNDGNTNDTKDSLCQINPAEKNKLLGLSRDDWPAEDEPDESATLPMEGSSAFTTHKIPILLDSDEVIWKLPVTDVCKTHTSQREAVDFHNVSDAKVSAYEIPARLTCGSNSLGSKCGENRGVDTLSPGSKHGQSEALCTSPSHVPPQQLDEMCTTAQDNSMSTCDHTFNTEDSFSCLDTAKTQPSNRLLHAQPAISSSTNPGDSTGDPVAKAQTYPPVSSSTATFVTEATSTEYSEVPEADSVEYSLTRHVVSDKLSFYSSQAPSVLGSEHRSNTPDADMNRSSHDDEDSGAIASSALINDAYETAASDDNWEDASCVLPADDELSLNTDKDLEEVDANDLHSVYV